MSPVTLRQGLLAATLPLALASLAATRAPTNVQRISGKVAMKYAEQHPLLSGTQAEPMLLANKATGNNRNTGPTDYMEGAGVTSLEIADLTQGNGPHQGYIIFGKGADSTVSRWQGKITTTLSADKQPVTTFEGTWTSLKGTGRYEGQSSSGRYKGRMVSPTESVVEWSGEISLKTNEASR
jgi:hypothetical protein